MRRTADSFDSSYGYEPRYNDEAPPPTIRGLFNAIDSYQGKNPDIKTAIKKIDRILTEKADLIYASDDSGNTGLIHACKKRLHPRFRGIWFGPDYEIINTLLHYGADPNARNNECKTALHFACEYEPKCSKISHMYDSLKNSDEDKRAMLRVVRKLIKAGGDLRLHDMANRRPLDYARRSTSSNKFRTEILTFLANQQSQFNRFLEYRINQNSERYRSFKLTEKKPNNSSLKGILGKNIDFNLEQPRLKFTGYGSIIDHVGGKLSSFGEAASIPYVSYKTIFDQKGEQKLRLRILNFTLVRRVWRGTPVSFLSLEDSAVDEDKHGDQECYKIDRHDLLNAEIQKNSSIRHPNILLMMAVVHDPTSCLVRGIVYERVDLGTLRYFFGIGQGLECDEWVPLMQQICDASEFLHETEIIHQAICPESIMLTNHRSAKLGMLCFARSDNDVSFNWESSRIPDKLNRYIAPEVVRNEQPMYASDVYSLCATIYHLMTGEEPWHGVSNKQLKANKTDITMEDDVEPIVLQNAVRLGLQHNIKDRKTRLKDLNYHLSNLRAYQLQQKVTHDMMSRSTLSAQNSMDSSVNLKSRPPRFDSPLSRHSKSNSHRSRTSKHDGSTSNRGFRRPPGLPKRAMSLKQFEEQGSNLSFDEFLDVNQNKSIQCYEQMEPLHLNYEANSSESEQMMSNRTEPKDPRIEQYLREQFETSLEITANSESVEQTDDTTPIRIRKDKKTALRRKGTPLFGTRSDPGFHKKESHLMNTQSNLNASRDNVQRSELTLKELEDTQDLYMSANQSVIQEHDETPNNIFTPPPPIRNSTSNQRNMKQVLTDTVGKVFGSRTALEDVGQTYYKCNNLDSPPQAGIPNQSFTQQFPTPRDGRWQQQTKNVTINSDLNEEYTLSMNSTNNDTNNSFHTPAVITAQVGPSDGNRVVASTSTQNRALWGMDLMRRVEELGQVQNLPNMDHLVDHLSQSSIEGSENVNCVQEDYKGRVSTSQTSLPPVRTLVQLPSKPERGLIESFQIEKAITQVSSDPKLQIRNVQAHAAPCQYGERRDSFDFAFKNKVDLDKVLNSRINLNSPDYIDSSLVEEKQNLRDIETIPSITLQSPTPEKVHLRPVLQSTSLPCPFNVRSEEHLKPSLSLIPVEEESLSTYSSLDTRTPSRLTFHEKVAKFRTMSVGPNDLDLPTKMVIQNHGINDGIARGMVTSTPAVCRTIPAGKCVEAAEEIVNRSLEEAQREIHSPSEIAQNIKDMLDQSAAEDLPTELTDGVSMMDRRAILMRCHHHETFSESICYGNDIKYDQDGDEEPTNVSMWEEGYDDEPIVGNEKVNIDLSELDTPDIPALSSPDFNFDETHKISLCDTETSDTFLTINENTMVN